MANELDMQAYHNDEDALNPGQHKVFNISPTIHSFAERFSGMPPQLPTEAAGESFKGTPSLYHPNLKSPPPWPGEVPDTVAGSTFERMPFNPDTFEEKARAYYKQDFNTQTADQDIAPEELKKYRMQHGYFKDVADLRKPVPFEEGGAGTNTVYTPRGYGETIKAPAIRHPETGKVYEGKAHYDALEKASEDYEGYSVFRQPWEEGFTTSSGRYVDRKEAADIANKAHQTNENVESLKTEDVQKFSSAGRPKGMSESTKRFWNEDKVTKLKEGLDSGKRLADLADDLNVTRNELITHMRRLGLKSSASSGVPKGVDPRIPEELRNQGWKYDRETNTLIRE